MDKQLDTAIEINTSQEFLRDLLDCEVMLIGGGESLGNSY